MIRQHYDYQLLYSNNSGELKLADYLMYNTAHEICNVIVYKKLKKNYPNN